MRLLTLAVLLTMFAFAASGQQQPAQPQLSPTQQALALAIDASTQDALKIGADAYEMRQKIQSLMNEATQHQQALESQVAAQQTQNRDLTQQKAWFEDCLKQTACWEWLKPSAPVAEAKPQ